MKTALFKIKVGEVPYINPIFAYTLLNEPHKVDFLRINAKARVCPIKSEFIEDVEGYLLVDKINSIELWLEEEATND